MSVQMAACSSGSRWVMAWPYGHHCGSHHCGGGGCGGVRWRNVGGSGAFLGIASSTYAAAGGYATVGMAAVHSADLVDSCYAGNASCSAAWDSLTVDAATFGLARGSGALVGRAATGVGASVQGVDDAMNVSSTVWDTFNLGRTLSGAVGAG
jgi:hypothetical protein